jgi:hypothetical protein
MPVLSSRRIPSKLMPPSTRSKAIAAEVESEGDNLQIVTFAIGTVGILAGTLAVYLLASLAIARPLARSPARSTT